MTFGNELIVGVGPEYYASLFHFKNKLAVADTSRSLTWAELAASAHRLVRAWEKMGLRAGDKVAVLLKNRAEYIELAYSLARIAVVMVPLNYRYVSRELAFSLNFSDATILIANHDLLDVIDESLDSFDRVDANSVYVIGEPGRYHDFNELRELGDELPLESSATEQDIFYMPFTGGTTGVPKACLIDHRTQVMNWMYLALDAGLRPSDIMLVASPFHHGVGMQWAMSQLHIGGSLVFHEGFVPQDVLAAIDSDKITVTFMVPTMYTMLMAVDGKEGFDVSSLRLVGSAGSPLLTATKKQLVDYFPSAELFEVYGSTEGGTYSMLKSIDKDRKVRSVGQPLFMSSIRILDDEGNEVPTGTTGEIYKRGLFQSVKYYKNDAATDAQFRDGWHTSGDMGYLDDEGYLYISDRKKDMIVSGGVNVFPAEIEEALISHPSIQDVAVIGIPDEKWGEALIAFVVVQPGAPAPELTELIDWCRPLVAAFKIPRKIEILDELPKTGAGKLDRKLLRQPYWSERIEKV